MIKYLLKCKDCGQEFESWFLNYKPGEKKETTDNKTRKKPRKNKTKKKKQKN